MILIDDQPYTQACPTGLTVGGLAREVCADAVGEGRRMVVAVYCDGQAVADDQLNTVLDAPVTDFGEVQLQTQPVAAIVRATLEQAIGLLEDTARIRTAAADLLDRGEHAGAMEHLQKLLDIWRQVQQSLVFSAEALEIDLDSLMVGDHRFTELLSQMKASLGDLREAIRNHDTVLIGDLLRYELEDVFSKWLDLLVEMQSTARL